MRESYITRQADILPWDAVSQAEILIVGAGAIGSQVAMCLAKMGFTDITVYDDDTVGEENVNCQWYGPSDIGKYKVEALKENIEKLTGAEIQGSNSRIDATYLDHEGYLPTAEVVVSAVDSMQVRRYLWEYYQDQEDVRWFIDPRMSAEEGAIYTVDMHSTVEKEKYMTTLYRDSESVPEPCTAKATMYCAMLLAGQVAKNVKDIVVDETPMSPIMWNVRQNALMAFNQAGAVQ